ncbi:hypothetical protein L9F63_027020, partial [Diploptera punctata]
RLIIVQSLGVRNNFNSPSGHGMIVSEIVSSILVPMLDLVVKDIVEDHLLRASRYSRRPWFCYAADFELRRWEQASMRPQQLFNTPCDLFRKKRAIVYIYGPINSVRQHQREERTGKLRP